MGEVCEAISSEDMVMGVEERNSGKDGSSSSSEDVVRWEKFLPKMVLRVLLVEADDSTRQIIAALLRKCSYRVAAVPDGLKAWETLKGRPHNIDIVLTEMDLPSISGYALLTLVTEDDACKNIPVIMMSSCDSISLVLKCMIKGAADFLIKPVRKNELRNLWQHVWRRQNLAAVNAPENQKNLVHSAEDTSEKNEAGNQSSGCVASGKKIKDVSEKENDEKDFSRYNPGSVSNLNNHDEFKLDRGSVVAKNANGGKHNKQGLEVANAKHSCSLIEFSLPEKQDCTKTTSRKGHMDTESCRIKPGIAKDAHDKLCNYSSGAIDFVSTFDSHREGPSVHTSSSDGKNEKDFSPQLELSLTRRCPSDQGNSERDALNHSDYSPFSRYSDGKKLSSLSLLPAIEHTQLKVHETESYQILPKQNHGCTNELSEEARNDRVNMSKLRAEMVLPSQQLSLDHTVRVSSANKVPAHAHPFPPIYYPQASFPQARSHSEASFQEQSTFARGTSANCNPETHRTEQGFHGTDETMNIIIKKTPDEKNQTRPHEPIRHSYTDGQSLCSGVGNLTSSSTTESNNGRRDASSTSDVTDEKRTTTGNMSDGSLVTCDELKGMQSDYITQREAALMKFRLKRKDRCYEKKVRYQSRKRLAEQRPRVKGQFVRQALTDPSVNDVSDCP